MKNIIPLFQQALFMITHDVKEAIFLAARVFVLGTRPRRVQKELKIELPDRHHSFRAYYDEIVESMNQN